MLLGTAKVMAGDYAGTHRDLQRVVEMNQKLPDVDCYYGLNLVYTGGGAVKNLFYDAPVAPAALLRSSDERGAGGFRPIRASF